MGRIGGGRRTEDILGRNRRWEEEIDWEKGRREQKKRRV
jgi:hypothetical protein